MSVSGVSSGFSSSELLNLLGSSSTQSVGAASSGSNTLASILGGSASSAGDTAQISGPGQLFAQLQQLQQSNPTQFKQLTSQIAGQLQTAATQVTGGEAGFLANLATKFQTASQTGDVSSLQPSQLNAGGSVAGTYDQQGQLAQTLLSTLNSSDGSSSGGFNLAQLLSGSSSSASSSGVDLGQLFTSISQEVNQALSTQTPTAS
jgi:hypothetical protein